MSDELRKALEEIRDFQPSGIEPPPHTQIATFAKERARQALAHPGDRP